MTTDPTDPPQGNTDRPDDGRSADVPAYPQPYGGQPYGGQPYGGQPYGGQPYGGQPYPVAPKTNTLAIVSLVSSFFVSLVAVITGHIALGQIRQRGEAGRGLALAGLIIGYIGIAATAVFVVVAVAFAATFGAIVTAVVSGNNGFQFPTTSDSATEGPSDAWLGGADFAGGFLFVGTGPTTVDVYFDPMCPYCKQFEDANAAQLGAAVDTGDITLRLHALTFLDQASQGTAYSSRAAAALTCQAVLRPESTLDYLAVLYANQPAENTPGLSDDELVALQGADPEFADCVASGRYLGWSRDNTKTALNGPIPGAEIDSIQGTPTVLVNGAQYQGPIDDPRELAAFIAAQK